MNGIEKSLEKENDLQSLITSVKCAIAIFPPEVVECLREIEDGALVWSPKESTKRGKREKYIEIIEQYQTSTSSLQIPFPLYFLETAKDTLKGKTPDGPVAYSIGVVIEKLFSQELLKTLERIEEGQLSVAYEVSFLEDYLYEVEKFLEHTKGLVKCGCLVEKMVCVTPEFLEKTIKILKKQINKTEAEEIASDLAATLTSDYSEEK